MLSLRFAAVIGGEKYVHMSESPMCIFQCESFQVYQMNIQNAQPVSVNLPQTPADTRTEHSGDVPCQGDLQSLIRDLAIGEDLLRGLKVLLPLSPIYHRDLETLQKSGILLPPV